MATFELGCPLSLKQIAKLCRHAEYNPKVLNALILSLEEELPRFVASQSPTHIMMAAAAVKQVRALCES
jgi:TATA-box binding protein (TBP) (component of TFIID and TFIIIB)